MSRGRHRSLREQALHDLEGFTLGVYPLEKYPCISIRQFRTWFRSDSENDTSSLRWSRHRKEHLPGSPHTTFPPGTSPDSTTAAGLHQTVLRIPFYTPPDRVPIALHILWFLFHSLYHTSCASPERHTGHWPPVPMRNRRCPERSGHLPVSHGSGHHVLFYGSVFPLQSECFLPIASLHE